ncbi:MAG: preprotein translocase subunit SecG [Clostridia bacterium]|nr:preprotein translocase subunit SecG [Clostridia bacterium]
MAALKIVVTVIHILIAFGLMVTVLFQSGKSQGLSGSIAGGAETFFGKNKGKTMDGVLVKLTVILAILFVITSVSLSLIAKEMSNPAAEQEIVTEETPELIIDEEAIVEETTEEETAETAEETEEAVTEEETAE